MIMQKLVRPSAFRKLSRMPLACHQRDIPSYQTLTERESDSVFPAGHLRRCPFDNSGDVRVELDSGVDAGEVIVSDGKFKTRSVFRALYLTCVSGVPIALSRWRCLSG